MRTRLFAPLFMSVAGLGLLVGCGGGGGGGSDTGSVPVDAGLIVKAEEGLRFDGSAYSAKAGDVVVAFVNDSSLPHSLHFVTADGSELPPYLEVSQHGQTATKTIKLEAGTYTVICKIPGHSGMKATLTVS
jgi:plastocyanin